MEKYRIFAPIAFLPWKDQFYEKYLSVKKAQNKPFQKSWVSTVCSPTITRIPSRLRERERENISNRVKTKSPLKSALQISLAQFLLLSLALSLQAKGKIVAVSMSMPYAVYVYHHLFTVWVNNGFCEWNCKITESERCGECAQCKCCQFLSLSPEKLRKVSFWAEEIHHTSERERARTRKRKGSSTNSIFWQISFVRSLHQFGRVFLTKSSRAWKKSLKRELWVKSHTNKKRKRKLWENKNIFTFEVINHLKRNPSTPFADSLSARFVVLSGFTPRVARVKKSSHKIRGLPSYELDLFSSFLLFWRCRKTWAFFRVSIFFSFFGT